MKIEARETPENDSSTTKEVKQKVLLRGRSICNLKNEICVPGSNCHYFRSRSPFLAKALCFSSAVATILYFSGYGISCTFMRNPESSLALEWVAKPIVGSIIIIGTALCFVSSLFIIGFILFPCVMVIKNDKEVYLDKLREQGQIV